MAQIAYTDVGYGLVGRCVLPDGRVHQHCERYDSDDTAAAIVLGSMFPDGYVGDVDIGRRRRFRRAFKKVKRGLKKAVKKGVVRKAVKKVAKKVARSKIAKGIFKVAKMIPVYGQIADVSVRAMKGAVKAGRGIARRVRTQTSKRKLAKATIKALAAVKENPTPRTVATAKMLQTAAGEVARRDGTKRGRYIVQTPAGRSIPVEL